ncbi:hypothetical protein AOQ84DRAFT_225723 [Glonium stellatum]|uniref:Uncharacterized protein n=1 Tax=Glonium stellatum TaxID=574774 RepID=A0A8E2EU45_9PEZI|nr:hypothetical protein AOQ84DRAFT_225723 [Glonium stellatum]
MGSQKASGAQAGILQRFRQSLEKFVHPNTYLSERLSWVRKTGWEAYDNLNRFWNGPTISSSKDLHENVKITVISTSPPVLLFSTASFTDLEKLWEEELRKGVQNGPASCIFVISKVEVNSAKRNTVKALFVSSSGPKLDEVCTALVVAFVFVFVFEHNNEQDIQNDEH